MSKVTLQSFSGTHYEVGVQQGQAVRESVRKILEQIPSIEAIRLMKPGLLPTSIFLTLARRRATSLLKDDIFEYYPRQADRLRGLAEGAGIDLPTAFFMQSMELLIGTPNYRIEACTTLGFSSQRTTSAETIVAKNFDYVNDLAPYHLTCETKPKEGYRTLGCTMAPLPGILEGMNEHGLLVTYNLAFMTDKPSSFVPLSIVLREMLETCRSTEEAVKFITQAKRGGHDALLMLADAEGDIRAVEISSNYSATREMVDGQIINTNHYHTDKMQQYEVPRKAVYSGKGIPKDWIGKRVHESSERRLKRAQELLEDRAKVDEDHIAAILRDHGNDDHPSNMTICQHGEYMSTLRSMIFYPQRKTVKILYGNPCKNEYTEFGL